MSTMSQVMTIHRYRVFHWSLVKKHVAEWRRYARSRSDLMGLTDRQLQDIGISRCSAEFEAAKPFWMA